MYATGSKRTRRHEIIYILYLQSILAAKLRKLKLWCSAFFFGLLFLVWLILYAVFQEALLRMVFVLLMAMIASPFLLGILYLLGEVGLRQNKPLAQAVLEQQLKRDPKLEGYKIEDISVRGYEFWGCFFSWSGTKFIIYGKWDHRRQDLLGYVCAGPFADSGVITWAHKRNSWR